MSREYVVATRRAMTIRVAEPFEFIRNIVDERRALSLPPDIVLAGARPESEPAVAGIIGITVFLGAFALILAYALHAFLGSF